MQIKKLLIATVLASLAGTTQAFALLRWIEQGPASIVNGGDEGLCVPLSDFPCPNNPVAGAINAIVADPTNADVLFVGTVGGGIWKTFNATAADPTWIPL